MLKRLPPSVTLRDLEVAHSLLEEVELGGSGNSWSPKPGEPTAREEAIPHWSPARPEAPVPKRLDTLFQREYFEILREAPPSPTMMRRFNGKIARLRKQGLAPEWMPNQKFSPGDMSHLVALALSQGASGGLDLADVLSDMPKLLKRLYKAAFDTWDILESGTGESDALKALVFTEETTMIGFVPFNWGIFFLLIQNPAFDDDESVVCLFD